MKQKTDINIMVGFRVNESLRNRITLAAHKEKKSVQELLTIAVESYLADNSEQEEKYGNFIL